jgi:hypothetical protein
VNVSRSGCGGGRRGGGGRSASALFIFSCTKRERIMNWRFFSLAHSLLHFLSLSFSLAPSSFSFSLAPRRINHALALRCILHSLLHQTRALFILSSRCSRYVQSITHLAHQLPCTFEGIGEHPHLANVLRERAREHSIHRSNLRGEREARAARRVTGCRSSPSSGMNLLLCARA